MHEAILSTFAELIFLKLLSESILSPGDQAIGEASCPLSRKPERELPALGVCEENFRALGTGTLAEPAQHK